MGIIQRDMEAITSDKAEELAQQRYGREFGSLTAALQMQVWMEAEKETAEYFRTQEDGLYEQMKDNGHKPKADREAHWAELELGRRLGK